MRTYLLLGLTVFVGLAGCSSPDEPSLYEGFQDPPAEARPFVRWWWNGNHVNAEEIERELEVLEEAGIGGVEINPIAMPETARDIGTEPVEWLSEDWNQLLATASEEARSRDMVVDMIVGSGWPFGGEFLSSDEYIQRVITHRIPVEGPASINHSFDELVSRLEQSYKNEGREPHVEQAEDHELLFASLVPVGAEGTGEVVDLTDDYENQRLEHTVEEGTYRLVYGLLQEGHRKVMYGAKGASGNVMDHYSEDVTRQYLRRLEKISEDTGTPLSTLLRALFCDSIELAGANWTDGFLEKFASAHGYRLEPYLPFVFYPGYIGYQDRDYAPAFAEELRRVRYDYNRFLVELFLDNFTETFKEFSEEHGLKARYQAYGLPFLMGMLEGNRIPHIPESNNWIYSAEMDGPRWTWSKGHGYMTWNHYAAAGGHLEGRRIISSEAMTNTQGVFKTSLAEIKQHDDMNFISGINHSVLHGFNYSPPEAGFPGWIRFGSYFSEQNTWWPYFQHWTDYNARLSYVFQEAAPQKRVAILAPTADIWGTVGLSRGYFHMNPDYLYELWEALSQNGSSGEYINQRVMREASFSDGQIEAGPMEYEALWLASVESLHPETATAIGDYVETGGTVVMIDSIPDRSLSLQEAARGDSIVRTTFEQLRQDHPDRVLTVQSPSDLDRLMQWTGSLLQRAGTAPEVDISDPNPGLYQTHYEDGGRDIYFFTNTWRERTMDFSADFPVGDKTPWVWNPETGERRVFPYQGSPDELSITLAPMESLLLVFDPDTSAAPSDRSPRPDSSQFQAVDGPWDVTLQHTNGETYERTFETLRNLTATEDSVLNSFAGTIVYETAFQGGDGYPLLKLNEIHDGVTEVTVNGQDLGVEWYGAHTYNLGDVLQDGTNTLTIRYTTVLANYAKSLEDNPTAQRWTRNYERVPVGLEGPVRLHAVRGQ